ncbi:motility hub protein FimV-like [Macrosteles quadrilineatus]|uniref:motility hub protein FimV-like n=1 Tax=Macrosteles quadrilineatus TaxID=74068 RepID=UPI0023E24CFC|nr:motility hub protein FimV-like [Macrosteles quadrilineatus]
MGVEQPPLEAEQPPPPEPEVEDLGHYVEPEDTPLLIEDMQQALMLLRRTSKSLSIEDLAKLLNEEGGEIQPEGESTQNTPGVGEVPTPETVVASEGTEPTPVVEGEAASAPQNEPSASDPAPTEDVAPPPESTEPQEA